MWGEVGTTQRRSRARAAAEEQTNSRSSGQPTQAYTHNRRFPPRSSRPARPQASSSPIALRLDARDCTTKPKRSRVANPRDGAADALGGRSKLEVADDAATEGLAAEGAEGEDDGVEVGGSSWNPSGCARAAPPPMAHGFRCAGRWRRKTPPSATREHWAGSGPGRDGWSRSSSSAGRVAASSSSSASPHTTAVEAPPTRAGSARPSPPQGRSGDPPAARSSPPRIKRAIVRSAGAARTDSNSKPARLPTPRPSCVCACVCVRVCGSERPDHAPYGESFAMSGVLSGATRRPPAVGARRFPTRNIPV